VADVALGLNLLILFACMAAIRATLTLPGLAGIALTIGMAVDTNILIFERIREEMRVGKTPRAAIEAGFRRALRTIVDTHLTVMGTAVILLSFTAYFFTRLLFDLIYMGRRKVESISI
jgi:preprotein translocase subunit SecD